MHIRLMIKLVFIASLLTIFSACTGKNDKQQTGKTVFKNLSTGNSATDYAISNATDDQANPRTVYLPDKQLYFVVWEDYRNRNTSGADIYGQFLDNSGNLCGTAPILIAKTGSSALSGNQTAPDVAYRQDKADAAKSRLVVVWQDTYGTASEGYVGYASLTGLPSAGACGTAPTVSDAAYVNYNASRTTYKKVSVTDSKAVFVNYSGNANYISWSPTINGVLSKTPVVPGSLRLKASTITYSTDNGSGTLSSINGGVSGTIRYNSGLVTVSPESRINPVAGTKLELDAEYEYYSPGYGERGDELKSRKSPRISYDPINDQFWVAWIESRSKTAFSSVRCLGVPFTGEFGDSSFIGFTLLRGGSATLKKPGIFGNISGADIFRNESQSTSGTNRLVSYSGSPAGEAYIFEFFKEISSISIASDDTSPETLFVWEGKSDTATISCSMDNSGVVTGTLAVTGPLPATPLGPVGPDNAHVFGMFEKEILLPASYAKWVDNLNKFGTGSNPAVAVDTISVPRKFLVAWEDNRGGDNTKIYGQLINSGGGLYNSNRIVSYQDSAGSGSNDPIVLNSRQTRPFITYDSFTQRYLVTWQDERNSSVSTGNIDLYGQFMNLDGSLSGANYALSTAASSTLAPAIAYNPLFKQFLAVWKDSRNQATTASDIYAQRFTPGQPQMSLLTPETPPAPLTPALLNFGQVTTGASSYQSFVVKNTGDVVLVLHGITTPPGAPFSITPTTGGKLAPGAKTTYTLTYTPTASKTDNSTFVISSDAGTQTVALSGSGVVPSLIASAAALPFPSIDVGQTTSLPIVISNNGLVAVSINGFSGLGTPFAVTDALNKPVTQATLGAGESATYFVQFSPVSYGDFTGRIELFTSPQLATPVSFTVAGTGLQSILALDQSVLTFGNVNIGSSLELLLTISNTGNKQMTINSISIAGAGYSFSPTAFTTVGPGNFQTYVKFTPTSLADYNSTLSVNSSGGSQSVALTGTGAGGIASVSTTALDFGVVTLNTVLSKTLTITNTGNASMDITSITKPADTSFTVVAPTLPATLLKGSSLTLTVKYSANTLGTTNTSSMSINTNASNGNIAIGLQGGAHGLSIASVPVQTLQKGATGYRLDLSATGGTVPYKWAVIGGALPSGLGLDPDTGIISGSPSSVGPYDFVVQATDFAGLIATRLFTIVVNDTASTVSGAVTFTLPSSTEPISYYQYGSVLKNTVLTQSLTVNNNTSRDVVIMSASIADTAYAINFAVPLIVSAGSRSSIAIAFSPQDTNPHNSTLVLKDINGSTFSLPLYGTGATARAAFGAASTGTLTSNSIPVTSSIINSSAKPATFVAANALAVRIEKITASSTVPVTVEFDTLPTAPVFYKIVNSVWKPLTNYTLSGKTLTFSITDNDGVFDADITPGVIQDPIVAGSVASDSKASDSNGSSIAPPSSSAGGSGCFVATAAYGSYLDPHVMVLRHFRDDVLLRTEAGCAFVRFYYRNSPPIADFIARHDALRMVVRLALTPLVFVVKYPLIAALLFAVAVIRLFRRGVAAKERRVTVRQVC